MSFNYYFASYPGKPADDYIIEHGLNKLYLQHTHRKHIDNYISKEFKGQLFVDSGAYTAHTKGQKVDVNDYIEFLNKRGEHLTCFAQLDTIPGEYRKKKTLKQLQDAPEQSWENFLYMYEHVDYKEKIIPIVHQGENLRHLSRMLEWRDADGNAIDYIGLSPANDLPTSKKIPWFSQCFWIIKNSSNPNVKTHAFGMTALDVLESFPFYSADSTSYIIGASSGSFYTPYGNVRYDSKHKGYSQREQELHRQYVESIGCDYDKAISPDPKTWEERALISVISLSKWAENYEYKGSNTFTRPLFFRPWKEGEKVE